MLERTDAITNEVLEPITFVLAYPTVLDMKWVTQKKMETNANIEILQPYSFVTFGALLELS
jgi:hypothetical protein